jgi:hypothetical protein
VVQLVCNIVFASFHARKEAKELAKGSSLKSNRYVAKI